MAKFEDYKKYLELRLGSMYVLGAQGQKFIDLLDRVCVMEEGKISLVSNILTLLKSKYQHKEIVEDLLAYDCSGLFMDFALKQGIYKRDMTAKDLYNTITDKGTKNTKKVADAQAGDFLWEDGLGHIGYAIDNTYAIEARGTAYGVVQTRISERKWTKCARPEFWDEKPKYVLTRELSLQNPYMRGEDVEKVQERLNELGYNCGLADGIFGKGTEFAVKNFQTDSKLNISRLGVVGKKTAQALGFDWQ